MSHPHPVSTSATAEADVAASSLGLGGASPLRRWVVRGVWLIVAGGLIAAAVVGYRHFRAPVPVDYSTAAITRGDLQVTVTATGTLEPMNVVDVGSELSGRVVHVYVDFNDHVQQGQVVAELDTDVYRAQLEQAQADLALARAHVRQSRATVRESQLNFDRVSDLVPHAVSAQEKDAAQAALLRARAQVAVSAAEVQRAQAALALARTQLGRATIRSPIDGIVLSRSIEPGQTVVASLQAPVLFRIAEDLKSMTVSVDVDEADIGLVREGQVATFTVPAYYGRTFKATVRSVHNAAQVVDRVVTYEAELDVDNADLALRPGMMVTAQIVSEVYEDVLSIPNQALRYQPHERGSDPLPPVSPPAARVWVLHGGHPEPLLVERGPGNEARTVVTGSGLKEGVEVVLQERRP